MSHKEKTEPVKIIAKVVAKQSIKALLTAKKSDKTDKKSVSVALNSKSEAKNKSDKTSAHIVATVKTSVNNKELSDKNKASAKDSKVKAPVTVAAVSKNTPHNKKSKNAG